MAKNGSNLTLLSYQCHSENKYTTVKNIWQAKFTRIHPKKYQKNILR